MKVPASEWNRMVDYMLRNGVRSVLACDAQEWSHPWKTLVAWNETKTRFECRVKAGFVNGADVLTKIVGEDDVVSDVPLSDSPAIPVLSTRAVTAGVHPFFAALGVKETSSPTEDQIEQGITEIISGLPSDSSAERILRAADIVLRCFRPKTIVEWRAQPVETGSQAQFSLGSSGSYGPPQLIITSRFNQASSTPTDAQRLEGVVDDQGYDECLIATVFFVSPAGVAPDYELGKDWQAFTQHDLFWNAEHIVTGAISPEPENLSLNLAGLGNAANAQFIVNSLLAAQNDAMAAALQFLNAREIKGRITTPGHGTPPEFDTTARLDPPFPYKGRQ